MDESAGPCEDECPLSVLEMLSPTNSPTALDWRRRCYSNVRLMRRKLKDGDRVRFPAPISFTDGATIAEFVVSRVGSRTIFVCPSSGQRYRITGYRKKRFEIIPQTRVMKTVFIR